MAKEAILRNVQRQSQAKKRAVAPQDFATLPCNFEKSRASNGLMSLGFSISRQFHLAVASACRRSMCMCPLHILSGREMRA